MRSERVLLETDLGVPDGCCVDADGCLWNAEYGASRVVRYRPDGRVDRIVVLPVPNVTACCFGTVGFDTLFITTADRGGLFAVRPGPTGLPESRFAG
jgi:L-arabinonolactonase